MTVQRCAVGIVFALPIEAEAFSRLVDEPAELTGGGIPFHEGTIAGRSVAWCLGGVGRERATRATQLLLDGHRPRRIISAGFAGGLDESIPRGGLVEPGSVRLEGGSSVLQLASTSIVTTSDRPQLLTVDRIARTAAEKTALAAATGAAIVDMETFAVAGVAAEAGIPCHGLRVVSDAATDELPADVGRLVQPQSAARRMGTLLGMLSRRPRAVTDLWRLWERAVLDGRTLADGLVRLIETFEP